MRTRTAVRTVVGLAAVCLVAAGLVPASGAEPAPVPESPSGELAVAGYDSQHSKGPRIKWDWTMPANITDDFGWDFSSQQLSGPPDGLPDDPMGQLTTHRGKPYRVGGFGQYGDIPTDGRHVVVLDAGGTKGKGRTRCTWRIDSKPGVTVRNGRCSKKWQVLLPEGKHALRLRATDRRGTTRIESSITVRNVLVAVLGDSYSSGVGFPPYRVGGVTGPGSTVEFDDPGCYRSRWGGYTRTALNLEKADPRSNVTLVNVACGGAQVAGVAPKGGGILTPQSTGTGDRPAQVDQVNAIVGRDRIDVALMSIGGNDTGFGTIATVCGGALFGTADQCYDVSHEGQPLWKWVDDRLVQLEQRYDEMARCMSRRAAGICRTAKTRGGSLTPSNPLAIGNPRRVVQSAYPNLTTRVKKPGEMGNGSKSWIHCTFKATQSQPDAAGTYQQAPLMPWDGDWAQRAAYSGLPGLTFVPNGSPDGATVGPTRSRGLVPLLDRNRTKHGYSVTNQMFHRSADHGTCATAPGMDYWVNGVATAFGGAPQDGAQFRGGTLHPSDSGQAKYAAFLTPPSTSAAGLPVRRADDKIVPGKVRGIRLTRRIGAHDPRGALMVRWTHPKGTAGGKQVRRYQIRRTGAKGWNLWHRVKEPKHTFRGLRRDRVYRIQIQAKNSVGWGEIRTRRVSKSIWKDK